MPPIMNNPEEHQPPMRIRGMLQETRILLLCEGEDGTQFELIVASNVRPVPVPYTEEP